VAELVASRRKTVVAGKRPGLEVMEETAA